MNISPSFRGQPLLAFAFVMGCWTVMRVLTWDASAFSPDLPPAPAFMDKPGKAELLNIFMVSVPKHARPVSRPGHLAAATGMEPAPRARVMNGFTRSETASVRQAAAAPHATEEADPVPVPDTAAAPFYPAGREPLSQRRWSADVWLLQRRGGGVSVATGSAPATYGASQAGAVLRYSLAPQNAHRPAAYLRATVALNGSEEKEAALGLSVRPIASLPVTAAVEVRVTSQPGGTRLRPAAFAVTELPSFDLPMGMRGEVYAQAGYVGGRYPTGFIDGQLRADRPVARFGQAELRMGAGSWGGAQKGASRLDIGPTMTIGLGLGGMGLGESTALRLGIDWRFRVAGNAAPASGPAIALSAGF